jgi:hypothetical protein
MSILKRFYNISRSYSTLLVNKLKKKGQDIPFDMFNDFDGSEKIHSQRPEVKTMDTVLAQYYANLEIPYGSDRNTVTRAWKRLLKKYHPDLHSSDPEKKHIANIVTQKLNEAYREINKAITEKRV